MNISTLSLRAKLVFVADVYGTAVGRKRGTISSRVLNRGSRLDELASGASDVGTVIFESAMVWFSTRWPAGVDWPDGIARPAPQPQDGAGVVGGPRGGGAAGDGQTVLVHVGDPATACRAAHVNSPDSASHGESIVDGEVTR